MTQVKYDEGLKNFHKLKDYIKTSLSIKQNLQPGELGDLMSFVRLDLMQLELSLR